MASFMMILSKFTFATIYSSTCISIEIHSSSLKNVATKSFITIITQAYIYVANIFDYKHRNSFVKIASFYALLSFSLYVKF